MWLLYLTTFAPLIGALILLIGMYIHKDCNHTVRCLIIYGLLFLTLFNLLALPEIFTIDSNIIRFGTLFITIAIALRFITLKVSYISEKIFGLLLSITVVLIQLITFIPL